MRNVMSVSFGNVIGQMFVMSQSIHVYMYVFDRRCIITVKFYD